MRFRFTPTFYRILTVLALLVVALLTPTRSQAQVIAGTTLYFDHTAEEQTSVASYQLCVGSNIGTADCRDVGVTRSGTTATLTFTLPAWVPRGRQDLSVRAVWKAPLTGNSAPTNFLSQVVVGGPDRLRTTLAVP